jgi:hypothetical protein
MLKCKPETSILDDITFIQGNYKSYFSRLDLRDRSDERVIFSLTPVNDDARLVDVELNRKCYLVLRDTYAASEIVGSRYVNPIHCGRLS